MLGRTDWMRFGTELYFFKSIIMAENKIEELLDFYSKLNGEKQNNEVIVSKDVEDSFDSIEQIGRIVLDSEEILKRRRFNIGAIFKNAFQRFFATKDAGKKANVDPDWMARFIECAQDVSDEEMRLLWSKILSGEMNKPNSISVMTLETLRNMSKRDAETFHKLANFTVVDSDGGDPFIPNNGVWGDDEQKSDEDYGISYDELLWMQELRLINLNAGLQMSFKEDGNNPNVEATLKCGNLYMKISSSHNLDIPCYAYTRIGAQLHTLIEDIKPNESFFEDRIKKRYSSESTKIEFSFC